MWEGCDFFSRNTIASWGLWTLFLHRGHCFWQGVSQSGPEILGCQWYLNLILQFIAWYIFKSLPCSPFEYPIIYKSLFYSLHGHPYSLPITLLSAATRPHPHLDMKFSFYLPSNPSKTVILRILAYKKTDKVTWRGVEVRFCSIQ